MKLTVILIGKTWMTQRCRMEMKVVIRRAIHASIEAVQVLLRMRTQIARAKLDVNFLFELVRRTHPFDVFFRASLPCR